MERKAVYRLCVMETEIILSSIVPVLYWFEHIFCVQCIQVCH